MNYINKSSLRNYIATAIFGVLGGLYKNEINRTSIIRVDIVGMVVVMIVVVMVVEIVAY